VATRVEVFVKRSREQKKYFAVIFGGAKSVPQQKGALVGSL
jgi:hypothetical protein